MGYYVVIGIDDPGYYHPDYESARKCCIELQRNGYPNAIILGPELDLLD